MLWQIEIRPAAGEPDLAAQRVAQDARDLGIAPKLTVHSAVGYLLEGNLPQERLLDVAGDLFVDPIVQQMRLFPIRPRELAEDDPPDVRGQRVYVLLKPGVMDPVADSARQALADYGMQIDGINTLRKYWIDGLPLPQIDELCAKILANDSIEQTVVGDLPMDHLPKAKPYHFELLRVPIRELGDDQLLQLSRQGQLYLTLVEMQTIREYFQQLDRDPTDIELETIAQTWSEHCSHKTLAGRIRYTDETQTIQFENMLRETVFAATEEIRRQLGDDDWCVSVFVDNAGIVDFDDRYNVAFKVETHNHPSALEPYGGANTGLGGVIRDTMGTGLGAKPVCNTDVFCFAPPDTPAAHLPAGVQHPRRVMKGVVAGVRDYGNRMGIPTVNGAVYFDPRYLGNPLVYCGNVGIIPKEKSFKQPQPGDYIVSIGGRTGRDGIHGATFSSAELTSESESLSGGAVQIGNPVMEKMVLDVLLQARDKNLFTAVTDCGAGGFSSAVGEMGEKIGAEVDLDSAPLKYEGLSYTEIWISEAQERMVLSVPPDCWPRFHNLCAAEGVEATVIGHFRPTGRLVLKYRGNVVGDLDMAFLHDGRPPVIRDATYEPPPHKPFDWPRLVSSGLDFGQLTCRILGSLNVASKEWIVRQYDHEVQAGSVLKPLTGRDNDGPGDAAVVRPRLDSQRGLVISCGMNPCYGDFDTYHMAASAIDEALRNAVAVGADPDRIAILDNFCWGYTDRPETLGSLVRAALACRDLAIEMATPFISGKDSLNNEFSYLDQHDEKRTIAIPPSLLISAMGQIDDARKAVSMDLKKPGDQIWIIGRTAEELGGSHLAHVLAQTVDQQEDIHATRHLGGDVPRVDAQLAKSLFRALHQAIDQRLVRACHDLSEGGLAIAAAEMVIAGGYGARIDLDAIRGELVARVSDQAEPRAATLLFAESNSRFLCEIAQEHADRFARLFADLPAAKIGQVTETGTLRVESSGRTWIDLPVPMMKQAWQGPLNWHTQSSQPRISESKES